MIREFGHSREGNARPAENYEDAKKSAFIAGEQNVKLFSSCRAVAVNKEGGRIKSVIVRHIETGEETTLEAPLFADCTGDGTVGFWPEPTTAWAARAATNSAKRWRPKPPTG